MILFHRIKEGEITKSGINWTTAYSSLRQKQPTWWRIIIQIPPIQIYIRKRNRQYFPLYTKLWIINITRTHTWLRL